MSFVGLFAIVVGGAFFTPMVLLLAMQALTPIMGAAFGVVGRMAARAVSVAAPHYPDLPPVNLQSFDSDIADERGFVWNDAPDGDYWAALEAGNVMVSEPFAYRRGIDPQHNTITLVTDRGEETFTIIGVFYDYTTDQGRVYMADTV